MSYIWYIPCPQCVGVLTVSFIMSPVCLAGVCSSCVAVILLDTIYGTPPNVSAGAADSIYLIRN